MDPEIIHVEAHKTYFNYHVFLLFIPAVVFVFIIALIMRINPQEQVLGNTAEQTQSP